MSPRVRILPVCIFLAFMMLCVKSYELGSGLNLMPAEVRVSSLRAAEPDPDHAAAGADHAAGETTHAAASIGAPDEVAKEPLRDSKALLIEGTDPSAMERSLLQEIHQQKQVYKDKLADLEQRERLLAATEKRVQEKIGQLEALRQTIQDLVGQHEAQEEDRMRALVKIYENMKPKEAARIFEGLDNLVLLDVVERMKERKVAPILGNMKASRAEEITVELAKRRNLPVPKE